MRQMQMHTTKQVDSTQQHAANQQSNFEVHTYLHMTNSFVRVQKPYRARCISLRPPPQVVHQIHSQRAQTYHAKTRENTHTQHTHIQNRSRRAPPIVPKTHTHTNNARACGNTASKQPELKLDVLCDHTCLPIPSNIITIFSFLAHILPSPPFPLLTFLPPSATIYINEYTRIFGLKIKAQTQQSTAHPLSFQPPLAPKRPLQFLERGGMGVNGILQGAHEHLHLRRQEVLAPTLMTSATKPSTVH